MLGIKKGYKVHGGYSEIEKFIAIHKLNIVLKQCKFLMIF